MLEEHSRRRPGFRTGMPIRLAGGRVWSLPIPERNEDDTDRLASEWADPTYHAILFEIREADDPGDLFRAELCLAIHLLRWNYAVDGDDLQRLLDDRGEFEGGAGLSEGLHALAQAHLAPVSRRDSVDPLNDACVPIAETARLKLWTVSWPSLPGKARPT